MFPGRNMKFFSAHKCSDWKWGQGLFLPGNSIRGVRLPLTMI